MMEASDHRELADLPLGGQLNGSRFRRVFLQRQVRAAGVIVGQVATNNPTKVILAEDDHMVNAVPAECAHKAFHVRILPR